MKKNIIIICAVLTTLSLTAFGVINWNDSEPDQLETFVVEDKEDKTVYEPVMAKIEKRIFTDFIYDVSSRFNTIKKEDLDNLRSFSDYIGEEHAQRIVSYKSVNVIILDNDKQTDNRINGTSDMFNPAQIKLLQSLDYSTNFLLRADYKEVNKETGEIEDSYWTPYLTIVPEKQAVYVNGKYALMKYLKENSEEVRANANVEADKLQPAKLFFTVTKKGTIENVKLDRSSNYPSVDKTMIELITNAPGKWQPAENANGEKVNQELVVSFGLMGC